MITTNRADLWQHRSYAAAVLVWRMRLYRTTHCHLVDIKKKLTINTLHSVKCLPFYEYVIVIICLTQHSVFKIDIDTKQSYLLNMFSTIWPHTSFRSWHIPQLWEYYIFCVESKGVTTLKWCLLLKYARFQPFVTKNCNRHCTMDIYFIEV